MSFKLLHQLRAYVWNTFPLIRTKLDLDLITAIGAAEEEGRLLNMKQLGLLELGAVATVRRRIVRLVNCGYVRKGTVKGDGRVAVFRIDPRLKRQIAGLGALLNSDSSLPSASGREKE
jgi:hypothetical protein